ncbi:MAG TPA: T9SS type A sorting domain-containing protein, partial [Candidatus Udaeobacter sp.]|nr:T9SS type A sorting domain-containing protein [Candidatus Udaeobacter sp.]
GNTWSPLGSGTDGVVNALAVAGPSLFVGGEFTTAGPHLAARLARWDDAVEPVLLAGFAATWRSEAAVLRWQVASATDHLGFDVYREEAGKRQKLTPEPLSGRRSYELIDRAAPRAGARYWLAELSRSGATSWYGPAILPPMSAASGAPALDLLLSAGPNPLDTEVTFQYRLPAPADVQLAVYDVRGRHVATLVRDRQPAGAHVMAWNTRGAERIAGGVYFVRLTAGGELRTLKVLVAR